MAKGKHTLSCPEVAGFCEQLAMILKAGIYLGEGLEMMSQDNTRPQEQQVLRALREEMEAAGALAPALESAGIFPGYMIQMVALGEQTGHLEEVMESLAAHYAREQEIRDSIRTAVTYPAMMLAMVVIIVAVLLTQVMPIFQQVFAQLGAELTGFSRVLMNLGSAIRSGGAVIGAVLLALLAAGLWLATRGRKTASTALRRIPGLGSLMDDVALCRFAGGMALALRSGLNPEYALELVHRLNEDPWFGRRLDQVRQRMEQGEDMTEALTREGILTGVYGRMAAIGRKTGALDDTMTRIARSTQEEVDRRIARILSRIEPALVVILSLVVGIILMSVMFPLLGILSGM